MLKEHSISSSSGDVVHNELADVVVSGLKDLDDGWLELLLDDVSDKELPVLLNIGYVSNETNTDVHMYIEEFILVEIWIHCCTNLK